MTRTVTSRVACLCAIALSSGCEPSSEKSRAQRLFSPGAESSSPIFITAVGDEVFFIVLSYPGSPTALGGELWASDGTSAGTRRVRTFDDYPHNLAAVDGKLLFTAGNGAEWGVWVSDGTTSGTALLRGLAPNDGTRAIVAVHDGRYFVAPYSSANPSLGGVVVTDGTSAGTVDLGLGFRADRFFSIAGALVFFQGGVPTTQLWTSDGTADGTFPLVGVLDDVPAYVFLVPAAIGTDHSWLADFHQVVITDGTEAGTIFVHDFSPRYVSGVFADAGGALLLTESGDFTGVELWRSDGTGAGTVKITDLPDGNAIDGGWAFARHAGVVFLLGAAGLWTTDGTAEGTMEICPFAGGARSPLDLTQALLFGADQGGDGELWKSNGSVETTRRVLGIPGGTNGPAAVAGGHLFFLDGQGLWSIPLDEI